MAGPGHRLRFDLPLLHGALDQQRRERGPTWTALAEELGCTPSKLTDLRRARLADAEPVLRVTQWLGRPATTSRTSVETQSSTPRPLVSRTTPGASRRSSSGQPP